MKKLLIGVGLAALLAGAAALAQTVFPLQTSVTGTELLQNAANRTGAYFSTKQLATYISGQTGGINAQTGTSYTIAATDAGKLLTLSNGSAVAVTLPAATTTGFGVNTQFEVQNKGAGAVTITPTTSNINGSSTLVLRQNRSALIVSDGTNYQISPGAGSLSATPAVVPEGGTGAATFTAHGVMLGEGTGALVPTAVGTTGQLLMGTSAADPAFTSTLSGNYTFTGTLNQLGSASGTPSHVSTAQTTAPALTSCGTGSPAITGTDTAGIVTLGTSATGCIITFNVAYTGTPYCVVSWIATPLASQSYVTAAATITLTQTSASGNKVQYVCFGTAGG